jgi:hypothetical protein
MKPALILVVVALLLSLTSTSVIAKNATIGIYAVIDAVTFEPDGPSPNFIKISGVFVVPVPISSGQYKSPQRGFLYFRIPPGMEEATRKDWSELKTVAGTGRPVGFGQYWVPNPNDPQGNPHRSLEVRVHTDGDAASPEVYPLPHPKGIVKAGDKEDFQFDNIVAQLEKASRR